MKSLFKILGYVSVFLLNSPPFHVQSESSGDCYSSSRIVGGKPAKPGEFPFITALHFKTKGKWKYLCAGSIIAKNLVLTAAHCVEGINPEDMLIYPNYQGKVAGSVGDKVFTASRIVLHLDYKEEGYDVDHDIALVWLNDSIRFTGTIKPVCLASNIWQSSSKVLHTAGWGWTHWIGMNGTNETLCLRTVSMNLQDENRCSKVFSNWVPGMICAGSPGRDICKADSGAPLVIKGNSAGQSDILVGIAIMGPLMCGTSPSGYLNILKYTDWIRYQVSS